MSVGADSRSTNEFGMMLMIIAMLILPCIDAIAKYLTDYISTGQIVWGRFFFQTLIMSSAMLLFHRSFNGLQTISWPWQMGRGFFIAAATLMFFASLKVLPMADAISIFFVEPLLLTLVAPFVLKEKVGWRRLLAVSIGLIGALIVVRPSYEVFGVLALYPLAAAAFFVCYVIMTRKSEGAEPVAMQLGAGVGGLVTMSLALLIGTPLAIPELTASLPDMNGWLFLFALGLVATFGHFLIVLALKQVDASIAAPFQYLEIVMATFLGFVVFGDFPDPMVWLGIVIIIGAGLYVFYRERKVTANAG